MTFASERVARHSLRIPHLYAVEFLRHPPVVFRRWQADAGPSLVDCTGTGYDERYYYEATADQLRSIAEATEVFVKIEGLNGYVEKQFLPENIANFQDFVGKEVE